MSWCQVWRETEDSVKDQVDVCRKAKNKKSLKFFGSPDSFTAEQAGLARMAVVVEEGKTMILRMVCTSANSPFTSPDFQQTTSRASEVRYTAFLSEETHC